MGKRRKNVTMNAFNQDIEPPAENQQIVRALGTRGGNIVEVQYPNGSSTLCMMPAKFNRKLWVKRGGYLIIENSPEAEQDSSSRVTGTIVAVLYDEHVKQLKKMPGVWPEEFAVAAPAAAAAAEMDLPPSDEDECSDDDDEQQQQQGGSSIEDEQQQQQQQHNATIEAAGGQHTAAVADSDSGSGSDDGLPPLQQINNRRVIQYEASESSEDDSDECV